jgi:hypothetical protein
MTVNPMVSLIHRIRNAALKFEQASKNEQKFITITQLEAWVDARDTFNEEVTAADVICICDAFLEEINDRV